MFLDVNVGTHEPQSPTTAVGKSNVKGEASHTNDLLKTNNTTCIVQTNNTTHIVQTNDGNKYVIKLNATESKHQKLNGTNSLDVVQHTSVIKLEIP